MLRWKARPAISVQVIVVVRRRACLVLSAARQVHPMASRSGDPEVLRDDVSGDLLQHVVHV